MNKLIFLGLCISVYIGLSNACGFGPATLCGGGGVPSIPACQQSTPTVVYCPTPPLQNACSSGGGGSCGGSGGAVACGGCLTRRRTTQRRHTRDAVHTITEFVNSTDDHPVCNNVELHKLIEENLSEDAEKTKDAIHEAVTKKMHGIHFAVICSAHPFYFTSDNHMYCLHGNKTMTCYVFQSN